MKKNEKVPVVEDSYEEIVYQEDIQPQQEQEEREVREKQLLAFIPTY
jgi:hypothetical protein